MELGLILGQNLEKPGKRQNLGVFQGFSRSNFAFLQFSRFSRSPGNPEHEQEDEEEPIEIKSEIHLTAMIESQRLNLLLVCRRQH